MIRSIQDLRPAGILHGAGSAFLETEPSMDIAKPTLNRRMVLVSLLISSLARSAFADEHDPGDFVAEMYRVVGPEAKVSVFADKRMQRRFLSRRLRQAVRAMERRTPAGDAPDLDFDPVTNSNDPSVHDLRIRTMSKSATQAVVIADFQSHQDTERSVLRYDLVREQGWKVDDITASGKNSWHVRKIIEGHD
jgi:hypothetical protein